MNEKYILNLKSDVYINHELLNVIKSLPENAVVVDYGCGNFSLAKKLVEYRKDLKIICFDIIDFEPDFVPKGIEYYNINKISLTYFKDKAHLTICNYVIEHVENPIKFFENLVYITRKGGFIYVETENWTTILNGTFWFDCTHKRPFDKESLKQLCILNNVKILKLKSYISLKELLLIPYLFIKALVLFDSLAFKTIL